MGGYGRALYACRDLLKWIKDDGDVWNERHDEWSYFKSK